MTVRLLMKNIAVPAIQHLCAGIGEILAVMLLMNSQAGNFIQGDHSKDYMWPRSVAALLRSPAEWKRFFGCSMWNLVKRPDYFPAEVPAPAGLGIISTFLLDCASGGCFFRSMLSSARRNTSISVSAGR